MSAAPSRRWLPSSPKAPCPICGRNDRGGDCRISAEGDLAICHRGATFSPPADLVRGRSILDGLDGERWAYTGDTADGRAACFTLDKPKDGSRPSARVVPLRRRSSSPQPVPIVGNVELARLPQPIEAEGSPYCYSATQRVHRIEEPGGGKRFRCEHHDGKRWRSGAGPSPWPAWGEAEALSHAGGLWVLEAEGERCCNIARAGGLVAITQPGHAHGVDQIRPRYSRLLAAGVAGIVFLSDHDEEGARRAAQAAEAAAAEGLAFLHLPAVTVWPGLPRGGSIDDAGGTAVERVEAVVAAVPQALEQERERIGIDASKPLRMHDGSEGKTRRLGPAEVLARLPGALGATPRLDIRSREVLVGRKVLNGDTIGRLYLELSDSGTSWPKETTADAVALLADRNQFDPVADYLNTTADTVAPLPLEQWQRLDHHLLGIDDPIAARFLPQYLISAVARTFRPGCGVRRSLVLVGKQWRGKSELGRILFGSRHWLEGLKGRTDADVVGRMHHAWGVELAELNGVTRRTDQEALKATLTEKEDTFRRAYSRTEETAPRRFVFWCTSNGPPLRDLTGSTRFVCVPLPDQMLPLDWAIANRDAIWSRAVEQFRQIPEGLEPWDFVSEEEREQIAERNGDHQILDPWAERVARFLENRRKAGDLPVRVADLLEHLGMATHQQSPQTATRVRELAESYGWSHGRRMVAGNRAAGLWPPAAPLPPIATHCHPSATHEVAAEPTAPQSLSAIATHATHIREELGTTAAEPQATASPPATEKTAATCEPKGVAGVAIPEIPSAAADSTAIGGVADGWQDPWQGGGQPPPPPASVSRRHTSARRQPPPWLPRALELRHLGADAIAAALEAEGFGVISPRTIARYLP